MATLEKRTKVQQEPKETNSTLEARVELSQKDQAIAEAVNNSMRDQEMLVAEQGVKTEMQTLEQGTKTNTQTLEQVVQTHEETPNTLSEKELAKIKDNLTLKKVASEWIGKCESLLDGLKGDRQSKKDLKDKVERAIGDMKVMVSDEYVYETGGMEYKNRLGKIIFDYYSNREPARQIIMMGGRVPMISGTADTRREAKRDERRAKRNAEYQIDLSEIRQTTAIYRMIGVSASEWGDYCDFIGQGGIAIGHPVYVQHTAGFNQIKMYNPALYEALLPEGQVTYNTYCQRDPQLYQTYCRNNNIVCAPQSYNRRFGDRFANMMEQIFPERMNRDPRQRQAWSNIGSLLAIGGTIFMGFKALQSLKKDKEGNRNWGGFAGWAAGTLALLNADTVINTIQDAFNWHPAEKSRMLSEAFRKYGFPDETARDMVDRYVGAPVATMSALHFIPIYELESQHILEDKNGEFEFNYANYEKYINQLRRTNSQKDQVLKAGKKLDEDKSVGTGLKAFGIATWEKLRSLFGSDKTKTLADTDEVKNGWDHMVERVSSGVNAELHNNGLRIKDPNNVDAIMKEYEEKKDSTKISELILKWMKDGLLEFSESKPYTMKEMLENSDIDLENMTMKGFKYSEGANEVKFSTYKELFEVVYITDWIKRNFKGRTTAKDESPFHINTRGQLDFNDTEWYDLHRGDATVISLREFKNMPTIKDNKDIRDAYVAYLNDWRIKSLGK